MSENARTTAASDARTDTAWYALYGGRGREPARGRSGQGLDGGRGASAAHEVRPERAGQAEEPEPVWKQFFKHYGDYMQIVLVVAAIVSLLIGEWGTAIGLAVLTLFNAWLGYHQEGKAQAAAAALGDDDEGSRQGAARRRRH